MIRRLPIVPTLVVLLAVALMIRLGLWQLDRRAEKEALIATYAANGSRPPITFPGIYPIDETMLFRRASAFCLQPVSWKASAGATVTGISGWRHIAQCRTGAEGPGFAVDAGVSRDSKPPSWKGGAVTGRLVWAPDGSSFLSRLIGRALPPEPMIVSEAAAPGLEPSAQPDPSAVPNNHLSYAAQWFVFAACALVIYTLALWRREWGKADPKDTVRPE